LNVIHLEELLVILLVSMIIGFLAQKLIGIDVGGIFISTILGFLGGSVGLWIARRLDLPEFFTIQFNGVTISLVWSIIGATVIVACLGIIRKVVR
jgi:uncharacterized membrane protein YeaQ/YmgE (transglycosylase-associated protein family)